jgi:hypothetical protein
MKTIGLVLLFTMLASETCEKKEKKTETVSSGAKDIDKEVTDLIPRCIQAKIDSIKKEPRYNPPAEVMEYDYKGRRVFLFTSDCCDNYNSLFDESCNYICAPTGGFSGKGDMKCNDFGEIAKLVKLVWKDDRK